MKKILIISTATSLLLGYSNYQEREFIKEISFFLNYDTINWNTIIENYYDVFDWKKEICNQFYTESPNVFLEFEASLDYGSLKAAQRGFHHKLLPLREIATKEVLVTLDNTEALFDTVWLRYIRQEYNEDLMMNTYNEVMTPAIKELINILKNPKPHSISYR